MAILKALLLPPGSLLILGFFGLWLCRRRLRAGIALTASALGLLYIASTGMFAEWALGLLSPPYVDPREHSQAQAIVVLGGGTFGPAPEYGADSVNRLTLMRLRYAAKLYRLTSKPILASGGSVSGETIAEARQMQAILTDEWSIPVRWLEERSHDTFGNAVESYRILAPLNIKTIYLVTHAWHVPRAQLAFEHAGFVVIPAPTEFHRLGEVRVEDLVPRASAVLNSYYFFHEVLGYVGYWLKARI